MSPPKYVTDPEGWIADLNKAHDIVCIVIFRGTWCIYDKHYLKLLAKHKPPQSYLVAWTSEEEEISNAKQIGGYDLVIGDKTNALPLYLKEDELLPDLVITSHDEIDPGDDAPIGQYSQGMCQPGLIIFAHHGNLACHWEQTTLTQETAYGAARRPNPKKIWEEVAHRKHALDMGNAVMPVHGSKLEMCTHVGDV